MDNLKKQEKTIKEINEIIDDNLNESWISDFTTFVRGGVPGLLAKKTIETLIDGGHEEKERVWVDIGDNEEKLEDPDTTDEEKEEIEAKLEELNKRLDDIAAKIGVLQNAREKGLKYKKAEIQFNGKTELDIEQLKGPEFNRNLLGTMYFKVIGLNESEKYIDLKTNSFPNTFIIRLSYEKLVTHREQSGDAHLIYNKYGFTTHDDVAGEEKKCVFKFLSLS